MTPLLERIQNSRNVLGLIFMMPAALLLLLFLTYPLGLGVWLGFTDTKIGRGGQWIGLENYIFLLSDSVTQLALFNTMFYTTVADAVFMTGVSPFLSAILGLWILRERIPAITWFAMCVALMGMGIIFYGNAGGGALEKLPSEMGFQAIRVKVVVEGDAPREVLDEIVQHANYYSPVANTMRNPIPFTISLAD